MYRIHFVVAMLIIVVSGSGMLSAQESDLAISITGSSYQVCLPDNALFDVVLSNAGPDPAVKPVVEIELPTQLPASVQDYLDGDSIANLRVEEIFGESITITQGSVEFDFMPTCDAFRIRYWPTGGAGEFGAGVTASVHFELPSPIGNEMSPMVAIGPHREPLRFGRGACRESAGIIDCSADSGDCFGPRLIDVDLFTAPLEMVNDGTLIPSDGCEPIGDFTVGNIALVERGQCNFDLKALNAQGAGAAGVIIAQNPEDDRLGPDEVINPECTDYCGISTIPVAFISLNDSLILQELLASGGTTVTMGGDENPVHTTTARVAEDTETPTDTNPANDELIKDTEWVYDCYSMYADFSWQPEFPFDLTEVHFVDESFSAFDPIVGWQWDFGDGGSSTEQNPVHVYTWPGLYTVTLTVSDGWYSDSLSKQIRIGHGDPSPSRHWIPAVAFTEGVGDSRWASDVEINNRVEGEFPLQCILTWLEADDDNSDRLLYKEIILPPGVSVRYVNIVGDFLGLEDVAGGLGIECDSPNGALVTSRTYTTYDDGIFSGSFGQSIPAVPYWDLIEEYEPRRLIHLSENSGFRTNIGFQNAVHVPIQVFVEFFLADGISLGFDVVDLPPYSVTQWNRAFTRVTANPVEDGYVDVWTETPHGLFTAYASVVGNDDFNDPTTILPD